MPKQKARNFANVSLSSLAHKLEQVQDPWGVLQTSSDRDDQRIFLAL